MSYTAEMQRLTKHVMQHALDHYDDGGWDVIVECYEHGDIEKTITNALVIEFAEGDPKRAEELAVAAFADVVGIYADRQADAKNSAF